MVAVGSPSSLSRFPSSRVGSLAAVMAGQSPCSSSAMAAWMELAEALRKLMLEHWCCEFVQTMDCSLVPKQAPQLKRHQALEFPPLFAPCRNVPLQERDDE